jgi:hypothetical protein
MGCLVDTFVVVSKYAWMNGINGSSEKDLRDILNAVPDKYRMMLRALLVKFESLDAVLENRNTDHAGKVIKAAEPYETDEVKFIHRYRGECLQQIIRTTFYDTLLILKNDYNPDKSNYFIILRSNEVITEEHWNSCMAEEQVFLRKVVGHMLQKGFNTITTIEGKTYHRHAVNH